MACAWADFARKNCRPRKSMGNALLGSDCHVSQKQPEPLFFEFWPVVLRLWDWLLPCGSSTISCSHLILWAAKLRMINSENDPTETHKLNHIFYNLHIFVIVSGILSIKLAFSNQIIVITFVLSFCTNRTRTTIIFVFCSLPLHWHWQSIVHLTNHSLSIPFLTSRKNFAELVNLLRTDITTYNKQPMSIQMNLTATNILYESLPLF